MTTDHIVYGVTDLQAGLRELEKRLGVRAAPGGTHPGRGTQNALLGLGGASYLEIIAPDPEQPVAPGRGWFGLKDLVRSRIVGWAVRTDDIDALVRRAQAGGYDPGEIVAMERLRPDGRMLEWRLTPPPPSPLGPVVPFLIDWGTSPHPSRAAPPGLALANLRIEHPEPESIRAALDALQLDVRVTRGSEAALIVGIDAPHGRIELR